MPIEDKHGYVAFYRGNRVEVRASTSRQAQEIAAKQLKARKAYEVTVMLAERSDGSTVKHSGSEL